MNALDTKIRQLLDDVDRATPPPPKFGELAFMQPEHSGRGTGGRPVVAVAAAAIVAVGIGGIVLLGGNDPTLSPADQSATDAAITAPAQTVPPAPLDETSAPSDGSGVLAPGSLPDGYVLYRDGAVGPGEIAGRREFIYGPVDASPSEIVEIVAGQSASGIACDASSRTVEIGDAQGLFCTFDGEPVNLLAAQQLSWISSGGTPVVLLAGSDVAEDELLAIANGIVINTVTDAPRLSGDDLTINDLPDSWQRLGYQGSVPLTATTTYEVGSATDPTAPTFLVHIYTGTDPGDIWTIMNGRHTSTQVAVLGTTGLLENSDALNPFLAWSDSNGTIVHIQNNGGTPESILTFAEDLTPLDAQAWGDVLQSAQDRPTPPDAPDGVATTTPS